MHSSQQKAKIHGEKVFQLVVKSKLNDEKQKNDK